MSGETGESDNRLDNVLVVRKGRSRYLVNGSDTLVERLQYSTAAIGENYVSSVPTYEVESIPARSGTKIEDVDPHEGGALIWQISEVDWADGTEYRGTTKRQEERKVPVDWEAVEREKTEIGEPNPPQTFDEEDDEGGEWEVF